MTKIAIILIGTVIILAVLFIMVPLVANKIFDQKVAKEIDELFTYNTDFKDKNIQTSDIEELPECVQRWMNYSGVVGREKINSVRLKQNAVMRLEKEKSWMPVKAEQYFTSAQPGFIWKARIKAAPLLHISGRDKYYQGRGNMLIKLLSLITIADSKGEKMDQGTMLRFLAESVWFPTAALSEYITWEEINKNAARASMSFGGITSPGVFTFNKKGEVINFTAERYREDNGNYSLATWSIDMDKYQEFNGIKIPTQGEVTWELDEGDFTWFKFKISDIEYNKPNMY